MPYDFVAGDTGSVLRMTLKDQAGLAVNLTGSTVKFRWFSATGLVEQAAVIEDALSGIVYHQFTAGQLFSPQMLIEVEVTDSLGNIVTGTDLVPISVRSALQ